MGVNLASKPSPRLLRRSYTVFIVALASIILAFILSLAASLYGSGRTNAVNMAAALEQFVGRSLEVSQIVARDALGYLYRRGSVEGLVQDRDAHEYFAELADTMSITEGMIFVDRNGKVVLHSGNFPAESVDLSDRDWFRAHVEGADHVISGSFISRVTGSLLFVHTFAMRDNDGALLGAVNIGIPSDALLSAQVLPVEGEGIVTEVIKETGEVIARAPFPEEFIGARIALPDQMQEGTAVLETGPTGRFTLSAYSLLPDYGLVVAVRIPLSVVLQPLMAVAALTLPLLVLIVIGALVTVQRLEAQQQQLTRSATRLEAVLHASNLGAWQWLPKTNQIEYLGRWAEMLGYGTEELAPYESAWERLLHPDERGHLVESFAQLLRGEKDEFYEEHRMRHKAGHWIWVLDSCRVVERDAAGRAEVVIGIHFDISERREAEERMRAVSLEVDHRSKNLLAVVQSLVSMTKFDSEEKFKSILRGRILALARAHGLLSRSRWKGADLRAIAHEELSPYITEHADRIKIDGLPTFLNSSAVQALSMALHELATNAAKHGALSVSDGQLHLTWSVLPDRSKFEILWEEHAAQLSQDHEPIPGFGSRLIRLMIESQLEGTVETEILVNGFRCRMLVPTALVLRSSADQPEEPPRKIPLVEGHKMNRRLRIMLVEDEAMLAAEISSQLTAEGHAIVASASRVSEATRIAAGADIEAAILDLNLHDELSFPVADTLRERDIPFIFMTGYEHESIVPPRFKNASIVRKPFASDALSSELAKLFDRPAREVG